jgi:circadian clock protein KaiC
MTPQPQRKTPDSPRADEGTLSTGIRGLDEILCGGFPANRLYLIQGDPGTGKTTLALQFLLEGVRRGERGFYVTLSETREELVAVARSHGWSLDAIAMYEVQAEEQHLKPEEEYTAFHPSEVELGSTVQSLLEQVERANPRRVVIDSLSEMRLLARDALRYRRQILALKHFFLARGCTLLLLDDPITSVGEHQFQTLAHGAMLLQRILPEYGRERRRLQVLKLRGVDFDGGYHDYCIRRGGLEVYPRLVAASHSQPFEPEHVSSGLAQLDLLLDGGPSRGTANLLMGPAGSGKSTLCIQYALAAAQRGERAAMFMFDERLETLLERCKGLGMDMQSHIDAGRILVRQIDPASLSPGEFIYLVRRSVEQEHARVVVIDSLNGYLNAMPGERFLLIQMHELLTYLAKYGVLTWMVIAQHGLVGAGSESPIDLSYLADTVLVLRYFEHAGRVRKALSVLKKRGGKHEDSIREFQMTPQGVRVGQPLTNFEGVLTGTPRYTGTTDPWLGDRQDVHRSQQIPT